MSFWARSVAIFKSIASRGRQSVRRLAEETGIPKSSVHRLSQAIERRNVSPESWMWETEEGRQWLKRLVVATLYLFGLKRGVGADTLSEFFWRLHLNTQVGHAPSAIRHTLQELETLVAETTDTWEHEGAKSGKGRDVIGAVDEPFLEQMLLVFLDLPTGYIVLEEPAEDRSYETWNDWVKQRLKALKTGVVYLVSDRAKALIQLAEQGLACLSVPDLFHLLHDLSKGYSLAIARRLRQARQDLVKAEAGLKRYRGMDKRRGAAGMAHRQWRASQAQVEYWNEAHQAYRGHLEAVSLIVHPVAIEDSTPQSSEQVQRRLQGEIDAIAAFVERHPLPSKPDLIAKVSKQVPALAALVDCWWEGGDHDVTQLTLSAGWRTWAKEMVLPLAYWEGQWARTRGLSKKAKLIEVLDPLRTRFEQHEMTQRLSQDVLADWRQWARDQAQAFQRASSAVEGRNGYLSQMPHNHRGLPKRRYRAWKALHNFDCRATDGSTPASRFFRRDFPDLFETVLSQMGELPRPRQRKGTRALSH